MYYSKYKKVLWPAPIFVASLLTIFLIPFFGGVANAGACIDKTPIETNVLQSGNEEAFCASHGGVAAQPGPGVCDDGTKVPPRDVAAGKEDQFCASHGGIPATTTAASADAPKTIKSDCNGTDLNQNNCGIIKYLVLFIKALSAIVGIVVVASIIIGGIQYSVSGDDPSAVAAAKKRIVNALLALTVYIFSFAFLQYLIPGGIF